MKRTLAALLLLTACAAAQSSDTPKASDKQIADAAAAIAQLRGSMRDVESFGLDKAYYSTVQDYTPEQVKKFGKKFIAKYPRHVGATLYCFEYRARNGYGGMNREATDTNVTWEGVCDNEHTRQDITEAVEAELAKHKD
jgi:hypothetical protein